MSIIDLLKKYCNVNNIFDDEKLLAASEEELDCPYDNDSGKFLFYTDEGRYGLKKIA